MNYETTKEGLEYYANQLDEVADMYIKDRLQGDETRLEPKRFPDLILYIHDRIKAPDNDDISSINDLFDAYYRLCCKYTAIPTLNQFGILCGINPSTFTDWKKGEYRTKQCEYSQSVKRWKLMCETAIESTLCNSPSANVNLIFVAKANYGWRDNDIVKVETTFNEHPLSISDLPAIEDLSV